MSVNPTRVHFLGQYYAKKWVVGRIASRSRFALGVAVGDRRGLKFATFKDEGKRAGFFIIFSHALIHSS